MLDGQAKPRLRGRRSECEALDQLLADLGAGQSQALVLRGEAGVGKTALLDYVQERASGCRVVRAAGVESEMELAYAGLHQLCAPVLGSLTHLPEAASEPVGDVALLWRAAEELGIGRDAGGAGVARHPGTAGQAVLM